MSGDGKVEIIIAGKLDGSLSASSAAAQAEMTAIAQKAGQLGAAGSVSAKQFSDALKAVGGDLSKITPDMLAVGNAAETAFQSAVTGAAAVEEATHGVNLATSGAIQEYIRLGHEAVTGNFSRMPGSMIVLASRTGGLETALAGAAGGMLGLGVAAGVVTAGLAYLAYEEYQAEKNAEAMAEAFALTGRAAHESADAVEGEVEQLAQLPNVTRSVAEAIVAAESAHAEWNDRINVAANQLLPQFAEAYGKKAPEALGNLKAALNEIETGPLPAAIAKFGELDKTLLNLAPAEADIIAKMLESGQRIEAVNRILADLASQGGGHVDSLNEKIVETREKVEEARRTYEALLEASTHNTDPLALSSIEYAASKADTQVKALEADLARLLADKSAKPVIKILPEDIQSKLESLAQDVTKTDAQILRAQIDYLQQEQRAQNLSAEAIDSINKTLATKRVDLARKTSAEIIETTRTEANAEGLTGARLAQAEIDADRALLQNAKVTAQDKLEIQRDLNAKLSSLHRDEAAQAKTDATAAARAAKEASEEHLRQMQEDAQQYATGSAKRIAADKAWLAEAIRIFGQYSTQAKAAFDAVTSDQRAMSDELARDAAEKARAEIKASDDSAQAQIRAMEQAYRYGQLTSEEEIALAVKVENARNKAALDSLAVAKTAAGENLALVRQIDKQIEDETAKHNKNLVDQSQRALDQQVQQWQNFNSAVDSLEGNLVSDLFQRNQSIRQIGLHFLEQMLSDKIRSITKDKLLDLESAHAKVVVNGIEAASTAASQATQTAAVVASQTAQTGAVIAGSQARVVAETAASTEGKAVQAAAGSVSIVNDAYKAAAGAFSAVAGIPIIGPILAPLAAAAAFAAVMAFDVLSAEGGAERIGADGTLGFLHKNESVLPARISEPLMDLVSNASAMAAMGQAVGRTTPINFDGSLSGARSGAAAQGAGQQREALPQVILDALQGVTSHGHGGGGHKGGDTYVVKALDTTDFRQFLQRASNRRALQDVARDSRRSGVAGSL